MPLFNPIRSARPITVGLALVGVIAFAAACTSAGSQPTPAPATPVPTLAPTPAPTVVPSKQPSPAPSQQADGVFSIDLEDPIGHAVTLDVKDETGTIVKVRSGKPGDGMSVRWGTVKVENVDAQTLRIVWVGLPRDEAVALGVTNASDKVRLQFTQAAPPPYSDAMGVDRMVYLEFAAPVRAEDVEAAIR